LIVENGLIKVELGLRNSLTFFFLDRRSAHRADTVHLKPLCNTVLVVQVLTRELGNLLLFRKVIMADGTEIGFLVSSVFKFLEVRKRLFSSRRGAIVIWHSSEDLLKKLVKACKAIREKIDRVKKNSDSRSWKILKGFFWMLGLRMSMVESKRVTRIRVGFLPLTLSAFHLRSVRAEQIHWI